jgi:poly(3-hydroxybutyrate) depolymerase
MAFLSIILFLSLLNLTSAHPHPSHLTPRAPFFQWFPIRTLTSSGQLRSYTFHLPSPYDPSKTYPVVLAFHGSSSIGTFLELDTKMSQSRYSGDKIMIYPNGEGGSWAGPSYHNGSTVAEDVQFVRDVIEDVKSEFCVDEDNVFGVG